MKARLLLLALSVTVATSAFAASIRRDTLEIYFTGTQRLNNQQLLGTSVRLTYLSGIFDTPTVTDWKAVHAIEYAFGGGVYSSPGQQFVRGTSYSNSFSAWGQFATCYRATVLAEAGNEFQGYGSSMLCTPERVRPCEETLEGCPDDIEKVNCPLIVNLGQEPWRLSGLDDAVLFDIDADGAEDRMGWTAPGSALAFVALDRNSNGTVDDASELFGDHTALADGSPAGNGFVALAEFDQNGDGVVNGSDSIWQSLLLWTDTNHDGAAQFGELRPISTSNIRGLGAEYHRTGRTDEHGNEFRFQSHVFKDHGREPYYDIFFRIDR